MTKDSFNPEQIAYYFRNFIQTDFDELFVPFIKQVDCTGSYRPCAGLKKICGSEDYPLCLEDICDGISDQDLNSEELDKLMLTISELIAKIFTIGFNPNSKNLTDWQRFTLVKLIDFLKFMDIIMENPNFGDRLMGKIKNYFDDLFGAADAWKYFDIESITVREVISLLIYEMNLQLNDAEAMAVIGRNLCYDKKLEQTKILVSKGYRLIQDLIINSCKSCINSYNFIALIETIELNSKS